jgi:hypothetical protein
MGTGTIVSSVYDPMGSGETFGENYWSTHGVQWNTVTTGVKEHIARVQGINSNSMDKANGLGDLEFLSQTQPIQIGNRVWFDINENGIQDPEEGAGVVAGTLVTLRSPGIDGVYGNSDDQTWTTTTDANGNYYFGTLSSADNRKPASWTAIGNTLLKGYNYRLELPLPSLKHVTITNVAANTKDNIDSDAFESEGKAYISFNTNVVDHNFDFGIANTPLPLKLVSFTAQLKTNSIAGLKWETVSEENVSHFSIQKSTDGAGYTDIAMVKAKGFGSQVANYTYTDDVSANYNAGIVYYRLKSVDNDGKFDYSETRILKLSQSSDFTTGIAAYPNPVTNELRITIPLVWQNKTVMYEVIGLNGQTVSKAQKANAGQTETTDVSKLQPGIYTIRVNCNGQTTAQKIVKH